ncbi:hypothetical protein [uncultured Cohaesibacter sp.]|uniref:hypothetical protein n=1 Tax=uncultured Cohaesibacter sp. TaxID=1002546 RepID=UPI0029C7CA3E|nr:hypothetical protein [uncultured Cohaesibacter sp.]
MTDKKTYPVLSAVRHNGTLYKPDDPDHNAITLTEKEAKQLLKLKVIGEPADEDDAEDATIDLADAPDQQSDPASADTPDADPLVLDVSGDPDLRRAAIRNAFQHLKSDTDLTKAGEPKVSVIEKLVGFDVSADEVKDIWADVQAQSAALKTDPQGE